jgi:DNA-binding response OmpR family regulator
MNTLLEKPVEKVAGAASQNYAIPTHRILLVDDDVYARELNAGVLVRFGYKVDTAEDGAAAWKALNDQSYDLLITDNRMPRVTGLELIKKVRSVDMTLPIILASGTVPVQELKRNPWMNLDATLPKPFTLAELLDTVIKVLRAADDARNRVEMDFPVILKAISEIESTRHDGSRSPADDSRPD